MQPNQWSSLENPRYQDNDWILFYPENLPFDSCSGTTKDAHLATLWPTENVAEHSWAQHSHCEETSTQKKFCMKASRFSMPSPMLQDSRYFRYVRRHQSNPRRAPTRFGIWSWKQYTRQQKQMPRDSCSCRVFLLARVIVGRSSRCLLLPPAVSHTNLRWCATLVFWLWESRTVTWPASTYRAPCSHLQSELRPRQTWVQGPWKKCAGQIRDCPNYWTRWTANQLRGHNCGLRVRTGSFTMSRWSHIAHNFVGAKLHMKLLTAGCENGMPSKPPSHTNLAESKK